MPSNIRHTNSTFIAELRKELSDLFENDIFFIFFLEHPHDYLIVSKTRGSSNLKKDVKISRRE